MTHFQLPNLRWLAGGLAALLLSSCALPLPDKPDRPEPYDLGPAPTLAQAAVDSPIVALPSMDAPPALQTARMSYRLLYAGADQQPRPYAHARWTMVPSELLDQRLQQILGQQFQVLGPASGLAELELQTSLEDFSQSFHSPQDSEVVIRLRASLLAPQAARVDRLIGQRVFEIRRPAPSADAAGGAQAMRQATDVLGQELLQWIQAQLRAGAAAPTPGH